MVVIYEKQLQLSSMGRRRHSAGVIMNYIAVDAYRMGDTLWWFHTAWSLVLQLFHAIGILFKVVGLGALPGLIPIAVISLLNVPYAKMYNKYQSRFMVARDERLRATMEILNNMKIIKLQSWEDKFKEVSIRREWSSLDVWLQEVPHSMLPQFSVLANIAQNVRANEMDPRGPLCAYSSECVVNVNGTIAYISQASWIQSGTVRDNIPCGKPLDH
ncbi:hypothetical protein H0E87_007403, partial [Populus deltoides]